MGGWNLVYFMVVATKEIVFDLVSGISTRVLPRGQFLNVRLLLETRKDGIVVPASVVQRGPEGAFAFVLSNDVALVRPIKVAQIEQNQALIEAGLAPGERVVVDGQYKLQAGSKVKLSDGSDSGPSRQTPRTAGTKKASPTAL